MRLDVAATAKLEAKHVEQARGRWSEREARATADAQIVACIKAAGLDDGSAAVVAGASERATEADACTSRKAQHRPTNTKEGRRRRTLAGGRRRGGGTTT